MISLWGIHKILHGGFYFLTKKELILNAIQDIIKIIPIMLKTKRNGAVKVKLQDKIDKLLKGELKISFKKEYLHIIEQYLVSILGGRHYYTEEKNGYIHISTKSTPLWLMRKQDIKELAKETKRVRLKQLEKQKEEIEKQIKQIKSQGI